MYFPRAFSLPLSDPAGASGRGRTRSHHERDSLSAAAVMAATGVPLDDPAHNNDDSSSNTNDGDGSCSSRRPCKSDSDIAIIWKEGERKQATAHIFPTTVGEGHDSTRQQQCPPPAYPGIDPTAAAFDSGPGMEDGMDVANAYARPEGGGGDSFLGFGFDDALEELGVASSGARGRTRSTSFQETDELDLEGEGAGEAAASGGEGGAGNFCDLGWGDAAGFGEGDMAEVVRGRGGEEEEEEEEGGDADDLGSR